MFWSFISICLSTWLFVDASYRGYAWQRRLFKYITLLLLLLFALKAPMFNITDYLLLTGLYASLIGDVLITLAHQRLLYAIGAFFLSYLLYAIYFASQITLSFSWPLPLILLLVGILLITMIWKRLGKMRKPICALIAMTLVMVWLAGELYFLSQTKPTMLMFFAAIVLLINNSIWLSSNYYCRFRADNTVASTCYFTGHFLIIYSLYMLNNT